MNNTSGKLTRSHAKSKAEKWTFILLHLLIVIFSIWLLYFNGLESINSDWSFSDSNRATLLFFATTLYFIRHTITLFYLLERQVPWGEVFGLTIFMASFEIGLLLIGGGVFRDYNIQFSWLDIVAITLLFIGSYLNSFSEIQRKWWKQNPQHKGKAYTLNLFSYSMHINFFGDVVLFSGWALLTYNFWTLGLPLLMGLMFVFFHIPALDNYLRERYGQEFVAYEKRTKKLIPFIY